MSGGLDPHTNASYGSDGKTLTGFGVGFGEDGSSVNMVNPGTIDLSQANPALYAEIQRMMGVRGQAHDFFQDYLDPTKFATRRQEAIDRESTGLSNRFARMGLSGSSAEVGALSDASRRLELGFDDKRMSDVLKAIGAESSLSGQITKDTMMGQTQYGAFQDSFLDTYFNAINASEQRRASNMSLLGSLIKAGGTIAGAAIGGPAGAAIVGGGMASMGQSGMPSTPISYESQNFGSIYGFDELSAPSFGSSYGSGYAPGYGL